MSNRKAIAAGAAWAMAAALLSGCGNNFSATQSAPVAVPGLKLQGSVHGGQQPISGASIYLYVANTAGYGAANTNLLHTAVTTNSTGGFSITGDYSCTAGQQMYIVSIGGDTGSGSNPQSGLMAALGDCATLNANTFIQMNEVTTVGSVFALAPFMSSYSAVGTSPTNNAGLVQAFASVNKLVNVATGTAVGPALPANATGPTNEVYTLADVLSSCVNSGGGSVGDSSNCGKLFTAVTPSGGTAPTETIGAALLIAQNPANNVSGIFGRVPSPAPFASTLPTAPTDWTLAINYQPVGLNSPTTTTIDGSGNVYVANSGNNTVTVLASTGVPVAASPLTGNGLNAPAAVAIDPAGNAWVANKGGATVSAFTSSGGMLANSPFSGSGNLNAPAALAFDGSGNLWVANSGGNSATELNPAGAFVQQVSSGIGAPASIAIDPK